MLLLAKITAVTIGMVLTLNGAERPLPQEGRMQDCLLYTSPSPRD